MSEISKPTDERELGHGNQPFTNEQVDELEARAEVRDQRRPRKSRFSTTEQGELDETADTLRAEGVVTADALRAEGVATAKLLRAEGVATARSLDFNAIQKADLTHRFNPV
jgi:regulator of protease activity HflC (stomatin/prohibitin superfamily)